MIYDKNAGVVNLAGNTNIALSIAGGARLMFTGIGFDVSQY